MQITIGEVASELMYYSSAVEITAVHQIPFIRAPLTSTSGIAKCYMYVIQTAPNTYAACDTYDEISGSRLFPIGSIAAPFVSEKELIVRWLDHKDSFDKHTPGIVRRNMQYPSYLSYLYDVLMNRGVIKSISSQFGRPLAALGFTNGKIIKSIECEFTRKNITNGTIESLIEIVNVHHKPFVMEGLRPRELHCVRGKLRDLGIIASLTGNAIDHISFKKI